MQTFIRGKDALEAELILLDELDLNGGSKRNLFGAKLQMAKKEPEGFSRKYRHKRINRASIGLF